MDKTIFMVLAAVVYVMAFVGVCVAVRAIWRRIRR